MTRDGNLAHMTPRSISVGGVGDADNSAARFADPSQVELARTSMPPSDAVADLADVFNLLGEPKRVGILIALLTGPMAVRDLAAVIELSESATSHALRLLRAHRVVDVHRHGRNAFYALADSHVRLLLDLALEHVGHSVLVHAAEHSVVDETRLHSSRTAREPMRPTPPPQTEERARPNSALE